MLEIPKQTAAFLDNCETLISDIKCHLLKIIHLFVGVLDFPSNYMQFDCVSDIFEISASYIHFKDPMRPIILDPFRRH